MFQIQPAKFFETSFPFYGFKFYQTSDVFHVMVIEEKKKIRTNCCCSNIKHSVGIIVSFQEIQQLQKAASVFKST